MSCRWYARRALERHPTQVRLIKYKQCSAAARNCILQHNRAYKRYFLSSITFHTPLAVAWRKVRIMHIRPTFSTFPLVDNGHLVQTTIAKANLLWTVFQWYGKGVPRIVPWDLNQVIVASLAGTPDYYDLFAEHEIALALKRPPLAMIASSGLSQRIMLTPCSFFLIRVSR